MASTPLAIASTAHVDRYSSIARMTSLLAVQSHTTTLRHEAIPADEPLKLAGLLLRSLFGSVNVSQPRCLDVLERSGAQEGTRLAVGGVVASGR